VFGLTLLSEVPLPELPLAPEGAETDITVRLGRVEGGEDAPLGLSVDGDIAILRIEGVGRYRMAGGVEMVVEPDRDVPDRNLRLYLLGSAIAALLHQRGLLPLHANAVVVDGRAAAFMGHSGAGKSTLAAWFHDRGFPVLADDVSVVTPTAAGPLVQPGIPRLRLWLDALEATGRRSDVHERSFDGLEKFTVTTAAAGLGAVPLGAVYLLARAGDRVPGVERLEGAAAVSALVANTYRGAYVPMMGRTRQHLEACVELARQVPIFLAHRAWDLDEMDIEAGRLMEHAASLGGAG
jgi:hypothetical protein